MMNKCFGDPHGSDGFKVYRWGSISVAYLSAVQLPMLAPFAVYRLFKTGDRPAIPVTPM